MRMNESLRVSGSVKEGKQCCLYAAEKREGLLNAVIQTHWDDFFL